MTKQQRQASQARMEAQALLTSAALRDNACPECGQGVHQNLSLSGWVQCDGYGAKGFRKPGATPCDWQGFTR